jgi:hypothetical protein
MAQQRQSLVADFVDGAIAGAVATWVMGKATTYLYEHENPRARLLEDRARNGQTAYEVAAERGARLVGTELTVAGRERLGSAIHWALGTLAGALYGVLRPRVHDVALARGLAFGAAFWLLMDEGAVYALRLTRGPGAFPWQAHARGLAGHVTFGSVADAVLSVLQPSA